MLSKILAVLGGVLLLMMVAVQTFDEMMSDPSVEKGIDLLNEKMCSGAGPSAEEFEALYKCEDHFGGGKHVETVKECTKEKIGDVCITADTRDKFCNDTTQLDECYEKAITEQMQEEDMDGVKICQITLDAMRCELDAFKIQHEVTFNCSKMAEKKEE